MTTRLTTELSDALNAAGDSRLTVIDPATNREYVIVDAETLSKLETLDAIRRGIEQMENDAGQPLAEAIADIRESLKRRA